FRHIGGREWGLTGGRRVLRRVENFWRAVLCRCWREAAARGRVKRGWGQADEAFAGRPCGGIRPVTRPGGVDAVALTLALVDLGDGDGRGRPDDGGRGEADDPLADGPAHGTPPGAGPVRRWAGVVSSHDPARALRGAFRPLAGVASSCTSA